MTLKAYFWKSYEDADTGVAVVAHNAQEAKKLGWAWNGSEMGNDDEWVDQRVNRIKEADVTGIESPQAIDDWLDGLKRKMYCWVEEKCQSCGTECMLHQEFVIEGKALCEECYEKRQGDKNEKEKPQIIQM